MIDSQGNVWVGNNFLVGAQNDSTLWSGNLSKFAPNGKPLSPITTGFTGGGVSVVGFGLAIDAQDHVWADSYAGQAIAKFDPSGKPLSPPDGYTLGGRLGEMQGIIVTPKRDDSGPSTRARARSCTCLNPTRPKARSSARTSPKIRCEIPAAYSRRSISAIDQQDRIWITNNIGDSVTRFPALGPEQSREVRRRLWRKRPCRRQQGKCLGRQPFRKFGAGQAEDARSLGRLRDQR